MIKYIDENLIKDKQVLLKVDYNVALNPDYTIADDAKIKQTLPTLNLLLKNKNKLIITSHLGRPNGCEDCYSLAKIVERLKQYFPDYKIKLIKDFLSEPKETFQNQKESEIFVLENIRFYKKEEENDLEFAKKLADLAEIYVNDGFAVSHRAHASVVGITQFLPSFGGLLLKKEVQMLSQAIKNPQRPLVYIVGGVKISTKIGLIERLIEIADYIILGGALANNFLAAKGFKLGKSFFEKDYVKKAQELIALAENKNKALILPQDVIVGDMNDFKTLGKNREINNVLEQDNILDIGPKTRETCSQVIQEAKTIIWNGPVGYYENPQYRFGTDAIYSAIAANQGALSLLGGGDTLAALSDKSDLAKITHVSTGGGAMLEFIENGTLPGIEALEK